MLSDPSSLDRVHHACMHCRMHHSFGVATVRVPRLTPASWVGGAGGQVAGDGKAWGGLVASHTFHAPCFAAPLPPPPFTRP